MKKLLSWIFGGRYVGTVVAVCDQVVRGEVKQRQIGYWILRESMWGRHASKEAYPWSSPQVQKKEQEIGTWKAGGPLPALFNAGDYQPLPDDLETRFDLSC